MSDAATTATPAAVAPAAPPISAGYRNYALGLLLLIYILNFVDRSVVNILAEPIKNDLGLADWHIGLMSGVAFAIFYTFLGLPIAQIAERHNRPLIISIALAVWSAFTALSGLAQNFTQLVLARIGVGVGEAGCTPPAHSLISDYVPRERRASALALYSMGIPLGGLVGMAVGGIVADAYGWRMAFFVCGLPGLAVALLAAFTLVETRVAQVTRAPTLRLDDFRTALKTLAKKKTFWLVAFAASIKAFIGYGHAPFTASFFLRNHPEQIAEMAGDFGLKSVGFIGLALGLIAGTAGAAGALLGGLIADKFGARDLRAYVSVPAVAALVTVPVYVFAITTEYAALGIGVLAINAILGTLWYGPVYATAQSIVEPHMRATAAAILLFIINLIGLGLGPLAVGILSDVLAKGWEFGAAEGIRWALILSTVPNALAFWLFWRARRTIRDEIVS
ncbi:MAG: MFS transporter [Alphaproteobacteria bacterium]|nr:MFS transporter [Alphaproteobacteria bacterium]